MAQPGLAKITCSECHASYESEEELRGHRKIAHRHGSSGQDSSQPDGKQAGSSNTPSRMEQKTSNS
jgi:hypothetical protein